MKLAISSIRRDGGTQPRSEIDRETLDVYAEAMEAGAVFPPVVVFYDGAEYWLADGFHRVEATDMVAGVDEIECEVHQGTVADAQWYSFGANKTHGLRRTNADKQRAVRAALSHALSAGMSDEKIAKHVGVHRNTVLAHRATCTNCASQPTQRVGQDGRTLNTTNIGKTREQKYDGGTRVTMDYTPRPEPSPRPTPTVSAETAPNPERELAKAVSYIGVVLECESTPNEMRPLLREEQRAMIAGLLSWCQDMLKEE